MVDAAGRYAGPEWVGFAHSGVNAHEQHPDDGILVVLPRRTARELLTFVERLGNQELYASAPHEFNEALVADLRNRLTNAYFADRAPVVDDLALRYANLGYAIDTLELFSGLLTSAIGAAHAIDRLKTVRRGLWEMMQRFPKDDAGKQRLPLHKRAWRLIQAGQPSPN